MMEWQKVMIFSGAPWREKQEKVKKEKKRYYNQDQSKSDSHNKSLKEIIRLHGTNFIQTRFRLYWIIIITY